LAEYLMQLLQVCWQELCYSVFFFIWGFWAGNWTTWPPEVAYKPNNTIGSCDSVYIHMCVNTYSNGTWLYKRGGEILLNTSAGCIVVLGWWNGRLLKLCRGLVLSRSCWYCYSCWRDWSWHANVPVLVILVAAFVEMGLGRGRAIDSLPDLSTYRCSLQRGDDGVHTLSIVLLPSAAQQAW